MDEIDRRWYADPRLHSEDYFLLYTPAGPEETARQVDGLIRLLEPPAGARVLDLACGWGRVAVPLAQRGYGVTRLDLSEAFLAMGREAAQAAGVEVDFRRGDMREIPFVGEFDAVVMMGSAFGVLESDEEDQKVLVTVARALRPGGCFLLHQTSREYIIRAYQSHDWQRREGGALVFHERDLNLLESRNYVRMTIIEPDGSRRAHEHIFRFYTLTELVGMLGRAGLAYRAAWGDFEGSPYTLHSRYMIVLAEKGGG